MRWQFSAAQWDVLSELRDIEGYPSPIQVLVHGRTDVERVRIRAQVADELSRLGLLRDGRVEPDLGDALDLLRRPSCWVDSVWLPDTDAEQPVRVVAARSGTAGVCALQHPEQPGATVLEMIPPGGLAAAVVRTLPAHPPGTSPAVTVAAEPAAGPDRSEVLVPTGRTGAERARAAAAAILERPHLRAGQIAANARDASGRVRRSRILRWCDNPDGRYQVTVNPSDEQNWLVVTPADPQRLGGGVARLVDSVQPGQ